MVKINTMTREERQQEAVQAFLDTPDRRSIINACPRFGKIKVAIEIMWKLQPKSLLILAPRKDIFQGWTDDFMKFGWPVKNTDFVTFTSIGKIVKKYELVIVDEPHELSVNQQVKLAPIIRGIPILGLTGTLTQKTSIELCDNLALDTCYKYSIEDGVKEGIITDYQMFIHKVPLDDSYKLYGKNRNYTERKWFATTKWLRDEAKSAKGKHAMDLRMINIIQNSLGKATKTRELIQKFSNDRILVFCGVTQVADSLDIPVYHSKAREAEIFERFCKNQGVNQLATIKMMQAGITIVPINKGIVNYMSGNPEDSAQKICRFLGFEYANPDKKAEIHIVSSDESFETGRLRTGLLFFNQSKIITCV